MSFDDFYLTAESIAIKESLRNKFIHAKIVLKALQQLLVEEGYEVQTMRVSFNRVEDGLVGADNSTADGNRLRVQCVNAIVAILDELEINFCSLGCVTTLQCVPFLPDLLQISPKLNSSVLIPRVSSVSNNSSGTDSDGVVPDRAMCYAAAAAAMKISELSQDGNFHFCASFNCQPNTPFFPAAYHSSSSASSLKHEQEHEHESRQLHQSKISVGLECGDLLFIAFHGVTDWSVAESNLTSALRQAIEPIDRIVQQGCDACNRDRVAAAATATAGDEQVGASRVAYAGIDVSMNPGLASLPDSVGFGIEQLPPYKFGKNGNLGIVSVITKSLKSMKAFYRTVGYCGLMLPVMEDTVLAERAAETPPAFTLRDLLLYSSVCGVGLDTVPIPGDTSAGALADLYLDVGTMAYRLNKPLTCRVLPQRGRVAGDRTAVGDNPFLCNTKVFSLGV